jgi:hypothetical protein
MDERLEGFSGGRTPIRGNQWINPTNGSGRIQATD